MFLCTWACFAFSISCFLVSGRMLGRALAERRFERERAAIHKAQRPWAERLLR